MEAENLSTVIKGVHEKITDVFSIVISLENIYNRIDNRSMKKEESLSPPTKSAQPSEVCIMENITTVSKRLTVLTERLACINKEFDTIL